MRQLSYLFALIALFIQLTGTAQPNLQQDQRVDPLLKQVAAKYPGLKMFGRRDGSGGYVNMSVLNENTHQLKWFTCYGTAFDSVQLSSIEYNGVILGTLDPFIFYRNYCYEHLYYINHAETLYRLHGSIALKDTSYNIRIVFNAPIVRSAETRLQKILAMEGLMRGISVRLCLFDSRVPRQLLTKGDPNNVIKPGLAGLMIKKGGNVEYYNTDPLSGAAKIVLHRQSPDKLFVYNREGGLVDSVPLKSGKYTSLLEEKQDVFLLYRGWLELQWQQVADNRSKYEKWLHGLDSCLYKPVSRGYDWDELVKAAVSLQEQQNSIDDKIGTLIVPAEEYVEQLLGDLHSDGGAEISYLSGLGFAYTIAYTRGQKAYELAEHRGNVMMVVSDRKKTVDNNADGIVEYYKADVVNATDYYPFGALMPGRVSSADSKYRYGYNGKENDNEIKGAGNQQDYGMRIYDPRIARFLSVDPLREEYPELSPYQFASNTPLWAIDLDGLEGVIGMPTTATVKSVNASADYVREKMKELHETGMRNVAIAEQARQNAIRQGRKDGDGINWYVKSLLYLSPWWNTTAPLSDANDGAVLMSGKNLDGSKATTIDKGFATAGVFLPIIGGALLKKIFKIPAAIDEDAAKLLSNTFNSTLDREVLDCSDIAARLKKSVSGGEIIEFTPKDGKWMKGMEYGEEAEWKFHQVFHKDGYIYDPMFSDKPIDAENYMKQYLDMNPDNLKAEVIE